ncbi:MAG: sigma-70 family RNA polymerase sigma factor [Bacteroidales bacterium]|nr:sigma-70 family RNA polymerase sigma factor [Bacteroidales bacterium]
MTSERFQQEYLSLADSLWQVAWYILEDTAEAEDAVQELYLRLWRGREALEGIRNPKGYAVRVLRNLCLDRIRQRRKTAPAEEAPEPALNGRQDEQMDEKKRLAAVLAAIKSLPERQREVLTLRTLDGLSYGQIASRTGINYLTLRVLLSQARKKLKMMTR